MNDDTSFDEALERVLADHSPRDVVGNLSPDEQSMVRMAQLLRGTRGDEPSPVFRAQLAERIAREPRKISRRSAFFTSAAALAAGLLGGFGLDRFVRSNNNGSGWVEVAQADTLHDGSVHAFAANGKKGFIVKQSGQVRAISRLCTDIGCPLNYAGESHTLVCPCHGAQFDLSGQSMVGAGGPYAAPLPPLPKFDVKVEGNAVKVWTD